MSKKKTPWFPASVDPVRSGVYECDRLEVYEGGYRRFRRFLNWDGMEWSFTKDDYSIGIRSGGFASMWDSDKDKWRGLASDPSKP